MRTRRPRPAHVQRSAFAGFRFPADVIVLAVRWYLRFGLVLPRPRGAAHRARCRGRPRHHLPVGAAVHAAVRRRRPAMPARRRRPLAGRRDLCERRRSMAVRVSSDRSVRAGHRRIRLTTADAGVARRFFQRAIGATKITPAEVATDQAPVYLGVLEERASGLAPYRPLRQQPPRVRPREAESAAATDARPQAGP